MKSILDYCNGLPETDASAGDVLLKEGARSGTLYVLIEGEIEVFRDDVEIARVTEKGAVFGEMSVLLDLPHTASVRAVAPSKLYLIANGAKFLSQNSEVAVLIAKMLARRLQNANTYLVNIKIQFENQSDHFGMVDQVLETLIHQQEEEFVPPEELPRAP